MRFLLLPPIVEFSKASGPWGDFLFVLPPDCTVAGVNLARSRQKFANYPARYLNRLARTKSICVNQPSNVRLE